MAEGEMFFVVHNYGPVVSEVTAGASKPGDNNCATVDLEHLRFLHFRLFSQCMLMNTTGKLTGRHPNRVFGTFGQSIEQNFS